MNAPLFRKEIIEAKRERLEGNVVAAEPPPAGLYTILIAPIVPILLAFLIFAIYATPSRVRRLVAHQTGTARLYPSSAAQIRQFHVRTGDVVRAGQPLVS